MRACDDAPRWWSSAHHFATEDVETELIPQGIHAISTIRDRVEREEHTPLPIVWFVRFQRTWTEYVKVASPRYFAGAFGDVFDGFALAKPELRRLQARGDEIGWHYHAYNYVHRDDLSHQRKIAILRADLTACQAEIARRHAELEIHTFRFGWFFVPDYALFRTLRDGRIRVDASIQPDRGGRRVATFKTTYLPPITRSPRKISGVWFVPFARTSLVHDYEVVAHDLGWTRRDEDQASHRRGELEATLRRAARDLRDAGGRFLTYARILPGADG